MSCSRGKPNSAQAAGLTSTYRPSSSARMMASSAPSKMARSRCSFRPQRVLRLLQEHGVGLALEGHGVDLAASQRRRDLLRVHRPAQELPVA
jgi:hypothetical protein